LYGTTGGTCSSNGCGTIFKITPSGTLTTLYTFCSQSGCPDGDDPTAGLVQAADGALYGTTNRGGANGNYGTIFKITSSGALTTLYSFCSQSSCTDGKSPYLGGLVQAADGNLYGTTEFGGARDVGTIFKITPTGTLTTLYSFCSQQVNSVCTDGAYPFGGLVQAINGDLYGTTTFGGAGVNCAAVARGCGTVFKIAATGTLTTLYSFCAQSGCTDGDAPWPGLVQAANRDFYGTTYGGGAKSAGTVLEITPSGTLTTLYSFCSESRCTDGEFPKAGLLQGTDGNFYGTTYGGAVNKGTVFTITATGMLTTLFSFCLHSYGCLYGDNPFAGLVQDTNGTFYGTTDGGGAAGNYGTVFSLSVGLGPFVETPLTYGTVGAVVEILGTDLTGATSVSFNGTATAFTVVSPSLITATVPTGATTGTVQVVAPSGTLSSNVPFRVLP
jgi:uncharacterized repeat protein (TIGR03803 family)